MARSILVIKLGALGDIFLAMGAFQDLRAHHRADRIVLLTRPGFAKFAADMPWFDEVILDNGARGLRFDRWLAMRRMLRQRNFARVYDLQCNDRTAVYHALLGPGRRPEWVGMARGCSHPWPDYRRVRLPVPDRLRGMLASAGVPAAASAPDLDWFNDPLSGLRLPDRFVLLVPGCAPSRPYKRWPPERFAALARRLEELGLGAVVIGTADDAESVRALVAAAPGVVDLCGRTSLRQIAALARRAAGVVGNDTGPVHIAAIVGAPTLVVMSGRSDPVLNIPSGPDVGYVQESDLADLDEGRVLAAIRLRDRLASSN